MLSSSPPQLFFKIAEWAQVIRTSRKRQLPFVVLPLFLFPTLSLFPGHNPAQEARCPAVKASCQCYFTVRPFVRCTGQIVVQEEAKISFNIGLQAQLETDLHANISLCMKCWHGDHRASPRRFYLSWCLRQRHGGFNTTGRD